MHSKEKGLVRVYAAAVSCTHPKDNWRQLAFHLLAQDLPKTSALQHREPHTLSNVVIYITHGREWLWNKSILCDICYKPHGS